MLWLEVIIAWETVSKGHSTGEVENHCTKETGEGSTGEISASEALAADGLSSLSSVLGPQ